MRKIVSKKVAAPESLTRMKSTPGQMPEQFSSTPDLLGRRSSIKKVLAARFKEWRQPEHCRRAGGQRKCERREDWKELEHATRWSLW